MRHSLAEKQIEVYGWQGGMPSFHRGLCGVQTAPREHSAVGVSLLVVEVGAATPSELTKARTLLMRPLSEAMMVEHTPTS